MRAPLTDPVMEGFRSQLERINALADRSAGFVWRLQTDEGDATAIRAFDDPLLLFQHLRSGNHSPRLHAYVTRANTRARSRQARLVPRAPRAESLVLWWIPAGHTPTVAEARAKLDLLRELGPTSAAFTFRQPFPAPGAEPSRPPEVDAESREGARLSAEVTLVPAAATDVGLLANLIELYVHDLSETFQIAPGEDGRFGYERLPLYFSEPAHRLPFLIRSGGRIAGFTFVTRGSPMSDDPGRPRRRGVLSSCAATGRFGIGRSAAFLLWNLLPGSWVVRVSRATAPASVLGRDHPRAPRTAPATQRSGPESAPVARVHVQELKEEQHDRGEAAPQPRGTLLDQGSRLHARGDFRAGHHRVRLRPDGFGARSGSSSAETTCACRRRRRSEPADRACGGEGPLGDAWRSGSTFVNYKPEVSGLLSHY